MKEKEQEEQVEMRRLRTENRLLRQRVETLEQENASLADKLIQVRSLLFLDLYVVDLMLNGDAIILNFRLLNEAIENQLVKLENFVC